MFGSGPKYMLGRLKGIPVRLDITFVIVPLALFSVMSAYVGDSSLWPAVAVGTMGVFLSVFFHELGHAAVAKWQQVGVTEIVVGGFFGYAILPRQATPRKLLLRILAAGPAANLAIFVLLWAVLSAWSPAGEPMLSLSSPLGPSMGWLAETLRVLALVNLGMFAFNMIPVFPLDGGKILGLLLDRRLSPRLSRQIVSILSVIAGVLVALFGLALGFNIFLAVIGILIVLTNLRRLRRRTGTQAPAAE